MKKIIEKTFKNANIDINSQKIDIFFDFFNILIKENEKINLTRIIDKEDVAKKHFLDSIMADKFIPLNSKIIDVGVGAGFPSVPLKIWREDLDITMVDSVNKKIDFLNNACKKLNLKKITAIHARVEDIAIEEQYREKFDVAVARAVAQLNTLCEYCLPFVKIGGLFIAYKSGDVEDEINLSDKAVEVLGGKIKEVVYYDIEEGRKNSLVIIEKNRRTPKNFPRRGNKPRKEPIL